MLSERFGLLLAENLDEVGSSKLWESEFIGIISIDFIRKLRLKFIIF